MIGDVTEGGSVGAATKLGHRPALDGLRGIAVTLVVLAHLEVPGFVGAGITGVVLFFALSGYLITRLLIDEGDVDLPAFYVRRGRRLLPALVVVVAVFAPMLAAGQVGAIAFYVGNWWRASGESLGVLNHTWSLAVEEQFYLAWPLVLICARRHAAKVAVVGIVAAVVLRPVLWSSAADTSLVQFSTFTRLDAILAGSLLALVGWRLRGGVVAAAVLAAVGVTGSQAFTYEIGLTIAMVASVVLVGSTITRPMPVLHNSTLRYLGRRSYGLYLWHFPLIVLLEPQGWGKVGVLALSLVVTEASWQLVERRFTRRHTPGLINAEYTVASV